MKKIVTILLSILACLTIVACNDTGASVVPPATNENQTETGNGTENGSQTGGGQVVTPIQPGGDFNGSGYGK